jgi:hypothetical protein
MLSMFARPPVATPASFPPCTERLCEISALRAASARHATISRSTNASTRIESPGSSRIMRMKKKLAVSASSTSPAICVETVSATRSFRSTRAAISPGERCE